MDCYFMTKDLSAAYWDGKPFIEDPLSEHCDISFHTCWLTSSVLPAFLFLFQIPASAVQYFCFPSLDWARLYGGWNASREGTVIIESWEDIKNVLRMMGWSNSSDKEWFINESKQSVRWRLSVGQKSNQCLSWHEIVNN